MLLAYRCSLASPHVTAAAWEAAEFARRADSVGVHAVPAIAIDGALRWTGNVPERVFVDRLVAGAIDAPHAD